MNKMLEQIRILKQLLYLSSMKYNKTCFGARKFKQINEEMQERNRVIKKEPNENYRTARYNCGR